MNKVKIEKNQNIEPIEENKTDHNLEKLIKI